MWTQDEVTEAGNYAIRIVGGSEELKETVELEVGAVMPRWLERWTAPEAASESAASDAFEMPARGGDATPLSSPEGGEGGDLEADSDESRQS